MKNMPVPCFKWVSFHVTSIPKKNYPAQNVFPGSLQFCCFLPLPFPAGLRCCWMTLLPTARATTRICRRIRLGSFRRRRTWRPRPAACPLRAQRLVHGHNLLWRRIPQLRCSWQVGDTLTASIKFTFNNVAPLNTSQNFRLGLFDFADSTLSPKWATADGFGTSSQGTGVQGYALFQNMGVTFNNASPMNLRKRTTATDAPCSARAATGLRWPPGRATRIISPASPAADNTRCNFPCSARMRFRWCINVTWQNLADRRIALDLGDGQRGIHF